MSDFLFCDEDDDQVTEHVAESQALRPWRILVVDDEPDIHQLTKMVLSRTVVEGHPLELVSAYSAVEARKILSEQQDFCLAFVDVVMENDSAGLDLVKWIREELKNQSIRLILRTGQAGMAPEERVIRDYDINDYKSKTELTALKLTSTVYAGIRGYRDIRTIERSLVSFRKLIESSTRILKMRDVHSFATAVLENLMVLMNLDSSALYIARQETDIYQHINEVVLARTGRFGKVESSDNLIPEDIRDRIAKVFTHQQSEFHEQYFIGYFQTSMTSSAVLYIEYEDDASHFKANLAELYATNVALILESLTRQQQAQNSQEELLYIVADAVEARSKETGSHVKRVAIGCALMAQKLGQPDSFVEAIKIAAPLHDLGKIAIPEHILHKPGKLDDDEWKIMQTHAQIGADILSKSNMAVTQMGAKLANWHHENWDGSGYPDGLKGEDIPLEARIMAIVDVQDALGSERCYKAPWSDDEILAFLREQSGIKFDPVIANTMIKYFDDFKAIRELYPD